MKSIKTRLILIFTSVILLMLLGLGSLFIIKVMEDMVQDAHEDLMDMAQQEAQYVNASVNQQLSYIDSLAQNPILLNENMSFEEKVVFFEAEAKRKGYLAFAFADKEGDVVVFNKERETTNVASRDYFHKALNGQVAVSDLIISSVTGELVFIYAAPVYKQGEIVGVVYGRKDGNTLSELMKEVEYKKTGYAYMINNQGVTVGHENIDLVLSRDNDIENMKTDESLVELGELTKKMITRTVGSGTYTYNGVEKIMGYAPVEDTQWIVIYGLEKFEAMESAEYLASILSMFIFFACLVGIAITYAASSSISKPLIVISDQMEDYSNNISISLPKKYLDRKDEIGVLSKGISLMLNNISNHILDLEEKNKELITTKEIINSERLLFETTIQSLGDGVISVDKDGNIQIMNEVAQNLTGWKSEDAYGLSFDEVFNIINEITREKSTSPIKQTFDNGQVNKLDDNTILINKNGVELPIEDSVAPIYDSEGNINGVVLVFRDCTDKKQAQADILYLSYHDQLTGLYNRHYFEEVTEKLDTKEYWPLSLVMLDVNGLKLTNDAFGHQTGDKLLKIVAETIKKSCRHDDVISRIGGDEFVLLLPKTSYKKTEDLIKRIYNELDKVKLNDVVISVSAGWETKYSEEQDIMEVFAKAEESMYRKKLIESQSMRSKTIEVILKALNETNQRERIHSENVSKISRKIGEALNFSQEDLREIEMAGLLHDIGKIAVDNNVLNKAEKLSEAEYEMVKRHPEVGYHILKSVDIYSNISEYVLSHHERWDGDGYPRGLIGNKIPLAARIITIADAYEAMTAERTYRDPISKEEALNDLRKCAGTQFDPELVKIFCEDVMS